MDIAKLLTEISKKTGYSVWEVKIALKAILETITEALEAGDIVKLPSFGNFEVKTRKKKCVRDINTGDMIDISEQRKLVFKRAATFDINSDFKAL